MGSVQILKPLSTCDPAARGRLTVMAKTMALDPPLLWKSATEEASEPLRRLLFSGHEVRQALAGQVAPDLEPLLRRAPPPVGVHTLPRGGGIHPG